MAALQAVLGLQKEKVVKVLRDAVTITKTEKGKCSSCIRPRMTRPRKVLLKGGGIGVLFALLFGPVGWVAAGAALGTAFAMFDRGIKESLLKELGENMTPEQSAMAVLVEEADWEKALGRMADLHLQGEVVVQEMVAEHLAAIEKLVDVPPTTEAVPEELKVEVSVAELPAEAVSPEPPVAPSPSKRRKKRASVYSAQHVDAGKCFSTTRYDTVGKRRE